MTQTIRDAETEALQREAQQLAAEIGVEIERLAEETRNIQRIPVFEWFVSLFSISLSIFLFTDPRFLFFNGDLPTNQYHVMLQIMPPPWWAFTFLTAGMMKSFGLLLRSAPLRVVGLMMSAVIYTVLAVSHAMNYPNLGTVFFAMLTVFSLFSVALVKSHK